MPERNMANLMRGFERVTLTRVDIAEGKGSDGDPVRIVSYWYHDDGTLLLRQDTLDDEGVRDAVASKTPTWNPNMPIGMRIAY